MADLKKNLKKRIEGAKRIALLAVGSELRGDDAAGMLVGHLVAKSYKRKPGKPLVKVFFGETAPENLTGAIKQFKPSHLVVIDAADLSEKPGTIALLDFETIGGASFSTHLLPLKIMTDYVSQATNCAVIGIGIQPKCLAFDSKPTKPVLSSVKEIAQTFLKLINYH
jgi:hydrogenase 3 maturation protease